MKSEQFMAVVKLGQREFVGLDIEGCFINEDLHNLLFENCFLEVDFTGANLEFVQYNDLIFKNNSAYGGDFTKEIRICISHL